ncbi:MAG TPA: hypothetical protein VGI57_00480 [Usitatibacter sp.]
MNTRWHAEGLKWLASLLQTAAAYLERTTHEVKDEYSSPNCVEQVRLRAHLRGLL